MAAAQYFDQVQKLYIAYFGRPADPVGLNYWATNIDAAGGSLNGVIAGFAASNESQTLYASGTTSQLVSSIYLALFNRNPEAAGLNYWVQLIDSGTVTGARAAYEILSAAGAGDSTAIANKLAAANAFTAQIDTQAEIAGYSGSTSAAYGRSYLAGVDATSASLVSATADANLTITVAIATGTLVVTSPGTPATAQTYTLTTGLDTVTGTALNDTINGTVVLSNAASPVNTGTLNPTDVIQGGGGIDTMNIKITGGGNNLPFAPPATVALPAVTGVETVNISASLVTSRGIRIDASKFSGLTSLNADRSTTPLSFDNVASSTAIGVVGDGSIVNGSVSFFYADLTTAPVINISGGTLGASISNASSAPTTTATINASGPANKLDSVGLSGALSIATANIHANSDLTITGLSGFASNGKVIIDGSASRVSLGFFVESARNLEVDASGLTAGGVTTDLGVMVSTFKGSAGNDVVTTSASAVSSAAAIDAGAGTDRLIVTSALSNTAALYYKGFEELQLNNLTQDVSLFNNSSISKLILSGGAVVQNTSVAQAGNIQIMNTGSYNIGVSGASTVGQTDTVSLSIDDGQASTSTVQINTLTLTGVENLKINAVDTTSIQGLAGIESLTSVTLSGSATIGIVTNTQFANGLVIDATATTGLLGVDLQNVPSSGYGATIKAGSGKAVLIGSSEADTLMGGAGDDILSSARANIGSNGTAIATIDSGVMTGADTLTGGGGKNMFIIAHSAVANISTITDLNLGGATSADAADTLWFSGAASATATVMPLTPFQQTSISAAGSLAAAVDAALLIASQPYNVAIFNYQSQSYLVVNGAAGGTTYDAADDALVKITGFTGTLDASDIHFL